MGFVDPSGRFPIIIIVGGGIAIFPFLCGCGGKKAAPPPPAWVGKFNIRMQTLQVTDPKQQAQIGPTRRGYVVSYVPPTPNPCPNGRIFIAQAVDQKTPEFDGTGDPGHLLYPEYGGQKPAPNTIADSPKLGSKYVNFDWHNDICAICECSKTINNAWWKVQTILGCVSIVYHDEPCELEANGVKTQAGVTDTISDIPASGPGNTWSAASNNYFPNPYPSP